MPKVDDDYSDAPLSIGELRSDRTGQSSDWTPRDVLIDMLRLIDSGELTPEVLCVAFGTENEVSYRISSPSALPTIGILYRVLHMVNKRLDD